jgi:hypothetical protein
MIPDIRLHDWRFGRRMNEISAMREEKSPRRYVTSPTLRLLPQQGSNVFETYWTMMGGVEAMDNSYALLDMMVYGRQETWKTQTPRPAGHNVGKANSITVPVDVPPPNGPRLKAGVFRRRDQQAGNLSVCNKRLGQRFQIKLLNTRRELRPEPSFTLALESGGFDLAKGRRSAQTLKPAHAKSARFSR